MQLEGNCNDNTDELREQLGRFQREGVRPKSSLKASIENFDSAFVAQRKSVEMAKPKSSKKQVMTMSMEEPFQQVAEQPILKQEDQIEVIN